MNSGRFPKSAPTHRGMSLRDYFAGQVLTGFAANPNHTKASDLLDGTFARAAYAVADSMLTHRLTAPTPTSSEERTP